MQISGFSILTIFTCFFLCTSSLHAQNLTVEGSVGIGTDTPAEKLQVENGFIKIVNNFPFLRLQSTENQNAGMEFLNSSGDPGGLIFYSFPSKEIVFMNQGVQHMFIEDSGRIGVGTNSPSGILTIGASGDDVETLSFTEGGSTDANFFFESDFAGTGATGNSLSFKSFWADDIMTFRGDGNVGIGTASPETKLQILGGTDVNSTDGGYLINGPLTGTNLGIDNNEIQARNNGNASELFINPEGGNITMARDDGGVGIGRNAILNVSLAIENLTEDNVGIRVETDDSDDGVYFTSARFSNTGTNGTALDVPVGFARKAGGGSWAGTSDARTKRDVKPYEEGLDILKAIDPVWYTYNGKGDTPEGHRFVGVIAQELDKVAQHMVIPGQDGYMAVDPSAFTYMLINATKELDKEVSSLRSKNQALQNRLADLENLVQQLLDQDSEEEAPVILNQAPSLEQNEPNPFQGTTRIGYFLPTEALSKGGSAQLIITSVDGKELQRISLSQKGNGQIDLQTGNFPAGTYQYSLVVKGQVVATRRMVIQ